MRALLLLSLFGLLFLTACSSSGTKVYNDLGNSVGQVQVSDSNNATIDNRDGVTVGKVTEEVIRDADGSRVGRSVSDGIESTIYDRNGYEVGSLKDKTDCYNDDGNEVGRLAFAIDPEAAAGACLLLLL